MRHMMKRTLFVCRFGSGRGYEMKDEKQFRRCMVDGDMLSLKISEGQLPMYSWFGKYSALMKLSTTDKDANSATVNSYQERNSSPNELALALEWVSSLTHRLRSDIIHPQCYKDLLSKYYSHFDHQNIPGLPHKLILNPNLPLQSLLVKSFIYQHHEDIAKIVKQNQLFLLEKLIKSRPVKISQFFMLINHNIFNVTDLPMLKTHFFNNFFPQVTGIITLEQIERTMAYLSNFAVLPMSFPRFFLNYLQKYVKDNDYIQVSDFLRISNILFQMVFHFHTTFEQSKQLDSYAKLLDELLSKSLKWQESSEKLGVLIKNNININSMIDSYISIEMKKMEKNIASEQPFIEKLSYTSDVCLDVILKKRLDLIKGWKLKAQLKKKSEIQIRTKMTRFMFAASYINPSLLDAAYRYLEFPKTYEFYMQNPYIPNLLKYTKIAIQLAHSRQIHQNTKEVASYFSEQLTKKCNIISKYLKGVEKDSQELLKNQENKQIVSEIVLEEKFENLIIYQQKDGLELQKFMNNKYNYEQTVINLLKVLKNDENFLSSLIKWNTNRYLSDCHINIMNFASHETSYWQYPFNFSHKIVNSQQQILKIHLKTAFNSNATLPNKQQGTKQIIFHAEVDNVTGLKIRLTQHSSKQ